MENKRKSCIAAICILLFAIVTISCANASKEDFVAGIDVSHHQGDINAQEVEAEFVVIRMGYSGYERPNCKLDNFYSENVEKFLAAEKKIALYWASHAVTLEEVKKENQFILETYNALSQDTKSKIGYIFIDREKIENPQYDPKNPANGIPQYIGRADYLTNKDFNAVLCGQVHQLQELLPDVKIGVYTNVEYLVNIIDIKTLGDVPIWIAWWDQSNVKSFKSVVERVAEDSASAATYLAKNIVMWQYSETGKVDGITEKVDLNLVSSCMFE